MKNVHNPLDVVVLKESCGKITEGTVGTVVEKFHSDAYLVEFCDERERTQKLVSCSEKEISKLNID